MHFPAKISVKPVAGLRLKSFSVLLIIGLLVIPKTVAQISDDFSDGDFSATPAWSGTDTAFHVNELLQLQLKTSTAGTSWLVTEFSFDPSLNTEWQVFVKQSFSPSSANFGRLYLMSDQADLSGPLNGYYLQLGEAGSSDALELFRQSGTTRVSLCRATAGAIATAFEMRVKVTRDPGGRWELYVDYAGGSDFAFQNAASDVSHATAQYFGMLCTFTATNATRFYYDDIFIRTSPAPDITPPKLISVEPTSPQSLRVVFSEAVEKASAENLNNYFVSSGIGHPVSAMLREDQKTLDLSFSENFANGYHSTLLAEKVQDRQGNSMLPADWEFFYFVPRPVSFKDVVLSELLVDPSPVIGLPEAEFAEAYNRSANAIDLLDWTLTDGNSVAQLVSYILLPGDYLVLAAPANAPKFATFGNVLSVSGFPSLNNAGDKLILKDAGGAIIDSVAYNASWFDDGEKADGGWSLELIDPENICEDGTNWRAADAVEGGSPGKQNSVFANKPDNRGPQLLSVIPLTDTTLLLTFNERLENTVPHSAAFQIDPPLPIAAVSFHDASLTAFQLVLATPMQSSTKYTIVVHDVFDCPGNRILEDLSEAAFVLPGKASPEDIVVNEILFNPRTTGVDFVEIYNGSDKTIDLKNWSLRNSTVARSSAVISPDHFLIHSKEYKVFTEDKNVLKGEYLSGLETTFIETFLPSFNDDEGSVVILDEDGIVIDSMWYSDRMHNAFIKEDEGISLERISFSEPGDREANWRSASSTSGFATPGYVNSNVRGDFPSDAGTVVIEPEIIQPHVPAQDFARINYRFDRGGFMANVRILDHHGRCIREIAGNELLGTDGFFRWDGDLDNGSPARTGYYMVWFEIFDDGGTRITYKKRVAVF